MTPEELLQYCKDQGELYEIRISLPNRRYHSPVRRRLSDTLVGLRAMSLPATMDMRSSLSTATT